MGTDMAGRAPAVAGRRACPAAGLCARQWDSHVLAQSPGTCHQPGKWTEAAQSPSSTTDEMPESPRLMEHHSAGCGEGSSLAPLPA